VRDEKHFNTSFILIKVIMSNKNTSDGDEKNYFGKQRCEQYIIQAYVNFLVLNLTEYCVFETRHFRRSINNDRSQSKVAAFESMTIVVVLENRNYD